MNTFHDAVEKIARVNLLVSSFCNGFSRVASPSSKKVLMSARETLIRQLTGLENILSEEKTQTDEELVQSSVSICMKYFDYFRLVLTEHWAAQVKEAERSTYQTHPLVIVAQNESLDVLRLALQKHSQEFTDSDKRLEFLLQRYFVGFNMFRDAISALKIEFQNMPKDYLTRSIVFPPEAKQAGMAILAYFGEVIEKKYPGIDCNVRIEQIGNKVSLIVETPNGEIEKIEHELSQYSLVVIGQMQPEDFMPRSLDALALKQKLELAKLEIRQARELLQVERAGFERRIISLEEQIGFMRQILDKTQYEASQASAVIRSIALQSVGEVSSILKKIADRLEDDDKIDAEQLARELQEAEHYSPGILHKLNELFVKGAIQGAAGNYLYAALITLQKMM